MYTWNLVFFSQIFRYFPAFWVVILLKYPVYTFHFGQMFIGFLTCVFDFY